MEPAAPLLIEKIGRITTITLNRPDKLNSLNPQMAALLASTITELSRDDDVGVVVITGAGRAFCSGADVGGLGGGAEKSAYTSRSADDVRRGFGTAQEIILGLQRMEKPAIAMVNGVAAGAGFDIACACDIRIGCPDTRFLAAYIRIGLFPGWGGTWLYPRVIGLAKAAEMIFTGDFLEADEALRVGALNKLVAKDDLKATTMAMAEKIAKGPPIAMRLAKLNLYKGLEIDLDTAMKFAAASETITLASEDHREGAQAFREKRAPNFQGR
ncbi:MAG: enoyl-CoA hydratase [Dehalococcoidia bacterium]|nr:enoyl-CoA hydratase [Dehalococcoidia bacterium]